MAAGVYMIISVLDIKHSTLPQFSGRKKNKRKYNRRLTTMGSSGRETINPQTNDRQCSASSISSTPFFTSTMYLDVYRQNHVGSSSFILLDSSPPADDRPDIQGVFPIVTASTPSTTTTSTTSTTSTTTTTTTTTSTTIQCKHFRFLPLTTFFIPCKSKFQIPVQLIGPFSPFQQEKPIAIFIAQYQEITPTR